MINNNIALSDEQQVFIDKALEGKNILVDACIGSGKTTAIQKLCDAFPPTDKILYLTYNKLLKVDAKAKIQAKNAMVTNYHGFAFLMLRKAGVSVGMAELIQVFNQFQPEIPHFDVLILDEYQDIELEIASMLETIKAANPGIQIVAVGDMEQKIYDKTTLDVPAFINSFLGEHERLNFTRCFRLPEDLAAGLGIIWNKSIVGVNEDCIVEKMNVNDAFEFLAMQVPSDILCLGARTGNMAKVLNVLESTYPSKFNKNTVYASIQDHDSLGSTNPTENTAIFTTYDSSKGLERPICVVFDFDETYWISRISKPQQSYKILRNIFCVAASRGKKHIIFVKGNERMLSQKMLATPVGKNLNFEDVDISQMFDFKYKESIEKCFDLLEVKEIKISDDDREIHIKGNDGLIDLSPCIGIYQEASFFSDYNINKEIRFWQQLNNRDQLIEADGEDEDETNDSLNEAILYLTSLETHQERYTTQVSVPFVSADEREMLCDRLMEQFLPNEVVQVECSIPIYDPAGEDVMMTAHGRVDVLKDNVVYELKFVSELSHENFLQCASYIVAMRLEKGILWNTRNNQAFEIRVPDRKAFLDEVVNTVTKGYLNKYTGPKELTKIARPRKKTAKK